MEMLAIWLASPIHTAVEARNRNPYHGGLSDRAETVDEDVAGHIHRWA
jgi:hypothetical protein